jgi:hypothetical protein
MCRHRQSTLLVKANTFGLQEIPLSKRPVWSAAHANHPFRVDYAVPGDVLLMLAQSTQYGADRSGCSGTTNPGGDIAVGGHVALRDGAYNFEHRLCELASLGHDNLSAGRT